MLTNWKVYTMTHDSYLQSLVNIWKWNMYNFIGETMPSEFWKYWGYIGNRLGYFWQGPNFKDIKIYSLCM